MFPGAARLYVVSLADTLRVSAFRISDRAPMLDVQTGGWPLRPHQALDELRIVLDIARRNVERFAPKAYPDMQDRTPFLELAMALEPLRFRLARSDRNLSEGEAYELLRQSLNDLDLVMRDPLFDGFASGFPWAVTRANRKSESRQLREAQNQITHLHPSFTDAIKMQMDAILADVEEDSFVNPAPSIESTDSSVLRRVVPAQQTVAPVQFEITDNRLVIKHQKASPARQDTANVEAAKASLLAAGERIREALKESNDDKRLTQALDEIQSALASEQDVINLGLMNFTLDAVRESLEGEIADPVNGMLKAHTVNLSMFVAQFPEWQRFNEQAEKVALEAESISRIKQATDQLVGELRARDDTVDPEVPKTIAALNALIADPSRASKRAVLAVIRSVENLIARAYQALAEFAETTTRDTLTGLSKAISKNAVRILVGIALASAAPLIPATTSLRSSSWVKTATEIVRHQIEKLEHD